MAAAGGKGSSHLLLQKRDITMRWELPGMARPTSQCQTCARPKPDRMIVTSRFHFVAHANIGPKPKPCSRPKRKLSHHISHHSLTSHHTTSCTKVTKVIYVAVTSASKWTESMTAPALAASQTSNACASLASAEDLRKSFQPTLW